MWWLKIPERFQWVSTMFVHLALILGVAVYTVFGALSMQYLESPSRVRSQIKRDAPLQFENQKIPPIAQERLSRVYLGEELASFDPQVHKCLEATISEILGRTNCDSHDIDHINIDVIDQCYAAASVPIPPEVLSRMPVEPKSVKKTVPTEEVPPFEKWSIGNSVIFAFTVITTIGYGHIAPETFEGRLFCIIYGLIGVPFTLLTIADLGMFLTKILRYILKLSRKSSIWILEFFDRNNLGKIRKRNSEVWATGNAAKISTAREPANQEKDEETEEEEGAQPRKTDETIALAITFTCYLIAGAKILSVYEPEMNFFNALYFNFVTLTTIGLGDFVPKSFDYLFVTLVYIGIGLALTTMAIEIAADLLKKIHYAGRKMEDVANAVVWFGGKKMKMKNLVKHLGEQFNIPEDELVNFDMTKFVDDAIKVEKGEMATLRKPPSPVVFRENRAFSYSNIRKSSEIKFADDSRVSKATGLTVVHESSRTMDTLQGLASVLQTSDSSSGIPRLDLDPHYFSDMSAPSSFDDDYMRTFTNSRKK